MSESFDVIIVGAGIVGAACALECARAGLRVLVLDRGPVAGGTTGAGMGHLVVMDDSEAQFRLTAYSRGLWLDLRPQLPGDVEFDPCGTLWVAADDQEMQEVRRKQAFYTKHGVRVEVLDGGGLRQAEPNLRPGMAGGLRVLDDAVIYAPRAACFLLEQAKQHGTVVRTGLDVARLLPEGGRRAGRRLRDRGRTLGKRDWNVGAGAHAGVARSQAQRSSRHHRPLPRLRESSDHRAWLP